MQPYLVLKGRLGTIHERLFPPGSDTYTTVRRRVTGEPSTGNKPQN